MALSITLAETVAPFTATHTEPPDLYLSSLSISSRFGDDPFHIRSYLADFSLPSATLEELASSIAALKDEEELSAVWVVEGLLVQNASDGWFVLYVR